MDSVPDCAKTLYAQAPSMNAVVAQNMHVLIEVKQDCYHPICDMDGLIDKKTRPQILQPHARVEGPCRRNPVWKRAPSIARDRVTHRMSYLDVFAEPMVLQLRGLTFGR